MASLNGPPFPDHIRSRAFARRALVAGPIASRADGAGGGGNFARSGTPEVSLRNNFQEKSPKIFPPLKTCSKCGLGKPRALECFPSDARKADGLRAECRVCFSAVRRTIYAAKQAAAGVDYCASFAHRTPKRRAGGYAVECIEAARRHQAKLDKTADRLRERVRKALGRSPRGHYSLGCTPAQLRAHLERQFLRGMSWANRAEWHIDHIRPLASFDLTDPDQIKIACHFTNLRPIWAKDNLRKGATKELLI